ncbi:ParA family protein [Phocea massiliensis]|uniref:Sporulation initiation inhibitor protein Soj n=1 Tax=Merdimmobilis hominis TaxID=2897707 RepID=A0A939BDJ1_9FIRM|nr:ParA family protein [Merdimmobilis hominis]MBM6919946.1 ParA family protein [Merdimmobilis hominis]
MGKIIAVANQKGGVGKTTSTVNLAACVGQLRKKVLLIDIDPQGNATSGVGINKRAVEASSYDLLIGTAKAEDVILKTSFKNLSVIPSNIQLAGAEIELVDMEDRVNMLKKAIAAQKERFDYIFIDCPPSLGLITLNALTACDTLFIPIQCEYYALEGLSQLMATVRQVKRLYNPNIDLEGVLLTMYDGRLNLTAQVLSEVKKYYGEKVYKTTIPRNVRLSEAPSYGQPVFYYDKSSSGTRAYMELANEFMKRNKEASKWQ